MQQLVRVFVDEDTCCPGFQFQADLSLDPVVSVLFDRAMALKIPHNYFALWMMLPCAALKGTRPVDLRDIHDPSPLLAALDGLVTDETA
ncbi:hypothetical protein [Paenarthrobacter aromaticivorans]|uniref:hypothetical protein n=1 Tax=Paenarthrobacter aromaticivorans TaxID=2849150 RepID=UPI003A80629C